MAQSWPPHSCSAGAQPGLTEPHRLVGEDQAPGTQAVPWLSPSRADRARPLAAGTLVVLLGRRHAFAAGGALHADHGVSAFPQRLVKTHRQRLLSGLRTPGRELAVAAEQASGSLSQACSSLQRLRGTGTNLAATRRQPETPESLQLSSPAAKGVRLRSA
ncbi:hypothetical protein D623_10013931 [Myotis brandtii]|uniref:Uncharacterized protein n=1 Tax=Myotis brandtii TaxID=109478 RepID=S7Q910_MYOBR|nr:hypothetical protein D623_10013931 [Myotis brandtii]